MTTSANAQR